MTSAAELESRVGPNTAVLLAGNVVNLAATAVSLGVVARALGSEGFGELSLAWAIVNLFATFTNFGVDPIVVRDLARRPHEAGRILGTTFALRVGLAVLAYAALAGWMLVAGYPPRLLALAGLGSAVYLASPWSTYVLFFQARIRLTQLVPLQIAGNLLIALLLVATAVAGAPALTLVGLEAAVRIAVVASIAALGRREIHLERPRSWAEPLRVLRLGLPLGLSTLLTFGFSRAMLVLIDDRRGAVAVGLFAAAQRLVETFYILPVAFMTSILPLLSATADTISGTYARTYERSFRYLSAFALPVAVVLSLGAGPIIDLLYGKGYESSAGVLAILAWALVFTVGNQVILNALVAQGRASYDLYLSAAWATAALGGAAWALPRWGLLGAAGATVAALALTLPIGVLVPRIRPLTAAYLRALSRSAVAAAPLAALVWAWAPRGPLGVLAAGFVGGILYVVLLVATRTIPWAELRGAAAAVRGALRPTASQDASQPRP